MYDVPQCAVLGHLLFKIDHGTFHAFQRFMEHSNWLVYLFIECDDDNK